MVLSVVKYITVFKDILNVEGHPNRITGSKVTTILLNRWFTPNVGASAVKDLRLQPAQQACSNRYGVIDQLCLLDQVCRRVHYLLKQKQTIKMNCITAVI